MKDMIFSEKDNTEILENVFIDSDNIVNDFINKNISLEALIENEIFKMNV